MSESEIIRIPIYVQYYDKNNNIIIKEVVYRDNCLPYKKTQYCTVEIVHNKLNYYTEQMKKAHNRVIYWCELNNINVNFSTYVFTNKIKKEWWTIKSGFFRVPSYYKKHGFGVIFRDSRINGELPIQIISKIEFIN
jgi:hypothetical protein